MAITRDEVLKTAQLANLALDEREIEVFTEQLSGIIDYVGQLSELDTSDVPPMSPSTPGEQVERTWRDDAVRPSLGQRAATAGAPEAQAGFFKIPSVISRTGKG